MRKKFLILTGIFVASIIGASFNFGENKASATVPYTNERVNTTSSGGQITDFVNYGSTAPAISGDGRYVVFSSTSTQLVTGDTNGLADVFVKDRKTGSIVRANTNSAGSQMITGEIQSSVRISDDGRFVAFGGWQTGLVPGFTGTYRSILIKDMQTGTVSVADISSSGTPGNANATTFDMSANGRYVTFITNATNLGYTDTNAGRDVYVRDRISGTTTLLSKSYSSGNTSNGQNGTPSISCDGAYIAFMSTSNDIAPGDANGNNDLFLVDRVNNTTRDITISANALSGGEPHVSCDGTTVIFPSWASNLVSGDTNGVSDFFAYNTYDDSFELVSQSSSGSQATTDTTSRSSGTVSYDGKYVVISSSDALASSDTNGRSDVYLRNSNDSTTTVLSMRNSSTQSTGTSNLPAVSANGRYVIYYSEDSGLVSGDTNNTPDIFVSETGL
jgi:Tol biopolymer transport system component